MVTQDRPDSELVARARKGNPQALDELVTRHHAAVYRLLLGMLSDESRAEDATQETFLKAVRGLASFRGESSFRTWLLTIATNEGRGMLRKVGRRRESPLDEIGVVASNDPAPDQGAIVGEELERVRACLDTLPEKQRMAVSLRIYEGLSFREVAAVTGSSEGAARVNYHHGIRKLRELLG